MAESPDIEGPQCEAQDSNTKLRCISTNTRLYYIPGKPLTLRKRRFCQEHGVMICPSGGGGTDEKGRKYPTVTWADSDVIVEKVPLQADIKKTPRKD